MLSLNLGKRNSNVRVPNLHLRVPPYVENAIDFPRISYQVTTLELVTWGIIIILLCWETFMLLRMRWKQIEWIQCLRRMKTTWMRRYLWIKLQQILIWKSGILYHPNKGVTIKIFVKMLQSVLLILTEYIFFIHCW